MFKIIDDSPTRLEKEFKAVKEMAKNNYYYNLFIASVIFLWSIELVLVLVGVVSITFFVATSVVYFGIMFFWGILTQLGVVPKRFKILYKKSYSSKR